MKRLRAALFAVLTVSVLSIGAMSAQAGTSSGPGARPAAAWAGPSAGDVIKRPDGVAVTLPMDWAKMTAADLAGIGIVPGMGPNKAVSSYQPTSGVRPASAYGCDGWVCIQLIGNGRLISNWYTSADNPGGYRCTFSAYWDSKTHVYDTGTSVCGWAPGQFRGYLSHPVLYTRDEWACNTWVGIVGKPCEWVSA